MWVQSHRIYDAWCKHGRKNNYILIQSSLSHVNVHYEDTRLREITLLPMHWSDVVWRLLLCRQLYTMCILRELATAISVQVTSVRWWDWSNTAQNAYGTVSLPGAIVKITENRVIECLFTRIMLHLISYELMRHNCQVYSVCRFIVFVWGPYISDWDRRLIVLLLYSYTICCFLDF